MRRVRLVKIRYYDDPKRQFGRPKSLGFLPTYICFLKGDGQSTTPNRDEAMEWTPAMAEKHRIRLTKQFEGQKVLVNVVI